MNCPRCRGNNPDNIINCQNCGLKLKISCPKCKTLNNVGKEKCVSCNLRLITFCPECKAPNRPIDKNCRKCNFQLLKQCSECKAINPVKNTLCFKCSKPLTLVNEPNRQQNSDKNNVSRERPSRDQYEDKSRAEIIEAEKILEEYASVYIEVINLAAIKAKLGQADIIQKIMNKFYQLVSIEAKKNSEKVEKISGQLICIKFKHCRSIRTSAVSAVISAKNIIKELDNLNYIVYKNFGLKLRVKIASTFGTESQNNTNGKQERSIATANDIVVNKELFKLTFNKFNYEKIGPIVTNNEMLTFYKVKESLATEISQATESENKLEQIKPQRIPQKNTPAVEKKASPTAKPQEQKKNDPIKKEIPIVSNVQRLSPTEIFNTLSNSISNGKNGELVSISAPDGSGKTTITNQLCHYLGEHDIIWLSGQCLSSNQFIPYAFFQDLLQTLFNLPIFTFNITESKKQVYKVLEAINIKNKQIEKTLFKLLFQEGLSSNIYESSNNKQEMYVCLNTLMSALNVRSRVVLFVDDFEFMDKASLDYLNYLIEDSFLNQGNNIIINHLPSIEINKFFPSYKISEKIISINLKPFSYEEIDNMILATLNNQDILPASLKSKIITNSKGSPLYVEQALWMLQQNQVIYNEDNVFKFNENNNNFLPDNNEALTQMIISTLTNMGPEFANLISCAAIFGQKFVPGALQLMTGFEQQKFNGMLQSLLSSGIFVCPDGQNILFKHKILWKNIFEKGFTLEEKTNAHQVILQILNKYIRTNSSTLAIHSELGTDFSNAAEYWNQASIEALSVGDIKAYSLAQERILLIIDRIEEIEPLEKAAIKINISEQLGKMNYSMNPKDGIKYLSNAISQNKIKNNSVKIVELYGFLSKSWELLGKPNDVIECVDNAMDYIDKNASPVELAMLNYSKLESIFNLGRLEEAIVLAKNNILPTISEVINKYQSFALLNQNDLVYVLLDTELILAKSLAFQGNKEAIAVAETLMSKAYEYGLMDIAAQAKITLELYYILQGKVNTLNFAMEYLNEVTPKVKDSGYIKLNWDFINLIYTILVGTPDVSRQISPHVIAEAENYKEVNLQSIAKLLAAQVIKETNNYDEVKSIFYDVINYCSENKMATGALLGWYLIAKLELENANLDQALSIAEKALDVAKKPNIQNHFFTILLQKLIAEVKITKGDFEMAEMFIQQAIGLSRNMELHSCEAKLLLTYGKMYHELATSKSVKDDVKEKNIKEAGATYQKALNIVQKIENNYLITKVEKEITNLNILSNLSGIIFEDKKNEEQL